MLAFTCVGPGPHVAVSHRIRNQGDRSINANKPESGTANQQSRANNDGPSPPQNGLSPTSVDLLEQKGLAKLSPTCVTQSIPFENSNPRGSWVLAELREAKSTLLGDPLAPFGFAYWSRGPGGPEHKPNVAGNHLEEPAVMDHYYGRQTERSCNQQCNNCTEWRVPTPSNAPVSICGRLRLRRVARKSQFLLCRRLGQIQDPGRRP